MARYSKGDIFRAAVSDRRCLTIVFGHTGFNQLGDSWREFRDFAPHLSTIDDPFTSIPRQPCRIASDQLFWFVPADPCHGMTRADVEAEIRGAIDEVAAQAGNRLKSIITNGVAGTGESHDERAAWFSDLAIQIERQGFDVTLISLNDVFVRNRQVLDGRELANVAGEYHEQILRQLIRERDEHDPSATMAARLDRLHAAGLVTDDELRLLHELVEVFLDEDDLELAAMEQAIQGPRQQLIESHASPVAIAIANIAIHSMQKERRALDNDLQGFDIVELTAMGCAASPLAERFVGPVETATAAAIAGAAVASDGGQLAAVRGAILGASIGCAIAFRLPHHLNAQA